jgi:HEAT repeats
VNLSTIDVLTAAHQVGRWCHLSSNTIDEAWMGFSYNETLLGNTSITWLEETPPEGVASAPSSTVVFMTGELAEGSMIVSQNELSGWPYYRMALSNSSLIVVEPGRMPGFSLCLPDYRSSAILRLETDADTKTQSSRTGKLIANKLQRVEAAREITDVFERAREEAFEDGVDSNFDKSLSTIITKYSHAAVDVIRTFLFVRSVSTEVSAEALRLIGRIAHPQTHSHRLILLEEALSHSQVRIRDGAVLGLAYLDNPSAIPHLKRAIQVERNEVLREDMRQVLMQLEDTLRCLFS